MVKIVESGERPTTNIEHRTSSGEGQNAVGENGRMRYGEGYAIE